MIHVAVVDVLNLHEAGDLLCVLLLYSLDDGERESH